MGKVITQEANVVPISAYTFLCGLAMKANSVLQRMSGTPSRQIRPHVELAGSVAEPPRVDVGQRVLHQNPGRMQEW